MNAKNQVPACIYRLALLNMFWMVRLIRRAEFEGDLRLNSSQSETLARITADKTLFLRALEDAGVDTSRFREELKAWEDDR